MRKKDTSNIKFLTSGETEELFSVIKKDLSLHALRNRAIFVLAKYCALRASEVGLLKMSDYNHLNFTIYCPRLKDSKNNTLKLINNDVKTIMHEYFDYRKTLRLNTDCLFPSQIGRPIGRKMLDYLMKDYCSETSIPLEKRHFHVLKHTRAMELIDDYEDISIRDVQFWLGHKNINNTMIYLDYTSKAMNALFEKIELQEEQKLRTSRVKFEKIIYKKENTYG